MKRLRLWLGISMLVMFSAGAPAAAAAVAVLEQLTGHPRIFEIGEGGARKVTLPRRGAEYTLPIEIETGAADSAILRLPDSNISIAADTIMRVAAPEPRREGLLQRIFHRSGSALFAVDRRESEHFEVETPFLVSVVKGTLFTVVVHEDGATVSLHEGLLEVASTDGSRRVELNPGEVAFSDRNRQLQKLENTMAGGSPAVSGSDGVSDDGLRGSMDDRALELGDSLSDVTLAEVSSEDLLPPIDAADALTLDADAPILDDLAGVDVIGTGDEVVSDGSPIAGVADTAVDVVDDLGDTASELLGDTMSTAGDLLGGTVDTAGDVIGDTVDTTGDLLDDSLADAGEDLADDLDDVVGNLVGNGGGLLGGLRP